MTVKNSALGGQTPFSYLGVEPLSPPNFTSNTRDPITEDYINFSVGHIWLNRTVPYSVWMLVKILDNVGTWVKFGTPYFSALDFITDAGTASQVASAINALGDGILDTDGAGNTVHINFSSGGTSGAGNVLIGGGASPAWQQITSTGGTIDITLGEHSINLEVIAVGGLASLDGDTGSATPTASNINIYGGVNLGTTAAGNTVTVNLDTNVDLAGTLIISLLGAGVVSTSAVGLWNSSNGLDGQLLIGATGAAAAWQNITSPLGSIAINNGPNSISLSVLGIATIPSLFLATQDSTASNVLGLADYSLGSSIALTSSYDVNNDLYLGDGLGTPASFVAPQTGYYFLYFQAYYQSSNPPQAWFTDLKIVATSRTLHNYAPTSNNKSSLGPDETRSVAALFDMTAGDTATFVVSVTYTSANIDILGDATIAKTYVYGYLVE